MKKTIFIFSLTVALLIQACSSLKQYNTLNEKLDLQQEELKESQKKVEDLEFYTDSLSAENQNYISNISELERNKANIQNELDQISLSSREKILEYEEAYNLLRHQFSQELSNLESGITPDFENRIDTINQTAHEISFGQVAFYCPTEMYLEETYDAFGLIADVLSDDDIKSLVVKNIKQHMNDTSELDINNNDFYIEAVKYYDIIELELDNVKEDGFEITKFHKKDKRQVSENEKKWHWKVTPKSSLPNQQLMLNVYVYDTNGNLNKHFSKTYHFIVKIRPNRFFYNTKELFVENPEWAFGAILLPLITFIVGRFQKRKKNKEKLV